MTLRAHTHQGRLTVEILKDGGPIRVILHGEADSTNRADLETALGAVLRSDADQVEVDVSDLAFVDIAALRELTLFARQLRESGRCVRTHDARPMLQELACLVRVQDDLGLA